MPEDLYRRNGEPEYMDRARNPKNYPYISNRDERGNIVSISTHRMAAEVDEKGNWYAFPMIVQMPGGELFEFTDAVEAMDFNRKVGNFKRFKDKKEALKYAEGGYKTKAMKEYNPLKFSR